MTGENMERNMADEAETETQEVETPEIEETEDQHEAETEEQHSEQEESQAEEGEGDEEETIIGFGDEDEEESSEDETPTIKRLRERNREQTRLLRERERELAELRQGAAKPAELGPKPTLESCEWDEEKFETALDDWKAKKADADAQAEKAGEQTRKVMESYTKDLEAYTASKATIGVPDFDDAEATVVAALNMEQQAVLLQAASNPAAMVVALSRSPEKLAELAKEHNPWKLSAMLAKMEGAVKVVKRKKAPVLDRAQRGSASVTAPSADAELERLEKEADRTGNRTALIAYKRQLKQKGQ
jgi:hypothetical protein